MNGLTVFHMNPQEQCHREEHSYPLVPGKRYRSFRTVNRALRYRPYQTQPFPFKGLTPIVFVKNEELNYLGRPYTNCIKNETYSVKLH